MNVRVQCPAERCGIVFEPPERWLGRNMYCPACGVRMTARPLGLDAELERRQRSAPGSSGQPASRLPLVVIVDNVRSLWNVGSIFRTSDACGVRELVLAGITGCPPRPEISKTALGAEEVVPWSYHADAAEAVELWSRSGYRSVALETGPHAVPIARFEWPERVALVVGNEVAGVGPSLIESCELHVSIPMRGIKDSLNVAVALGIAAQRAAEALSLRADEGRTDYNRPGPRGVER